ncbi:carbohydrate ABC transporter ATP-binding protein, CUT1 family (TC 3.A.1.1.-) [Desulfacinum hydrothermale DSM 13146]|uniref:Carbohydrate ABC transporter ATP-binding protein, CUT1 family (TC 3.A.1.1.-) n=1 Tax=Desulfacinum hydrothermale DSM 13146 TaxID=1121390 RepID=A0A1W1XPY2_9BACT|nr:ABC transporter ATP-binding protein [Desulfacinum hydrothermale]SMC26029.1 carbohydrate ABC transporter ATP-binding protein, CUT1 family (TC 3.A.1.1.-) [Desulfacinum hydrothermale DSM 13146]
MGLTLEHVDRIVDGETHLCDVTLEFPSGSRNILLGRTLAGKTTLLRIMAGLDRPTRGRVLVDGKDVTGVSVRKRNVAMVYQQFINYPSFTVYDNIASPLRLQGVPREEIDRRVREVAEMLRLTPLLDRLPAQLSGGQQQRTAIARALVKDADLLLLDEPLVNLDYKLREELREELTAIFERGRSIVVYTTTEPTEALMLGGNVVILDEGRVLQTGPTDQVYHRPTTMRAAEVYSDPPINYLDLVVEGSQARIGEQVTFALCAHLEGLAPGRYHAGLRANRFFLKRRTDRDVALESQVELSEINGSETFIHVNHQGFPLVVHETGIRTYKMGSTVTVHADPAQFFVFNQEGSLVAAPEVDPGRTPARR